MIALNMLVSKIIDSMMWRTTLLSLLAILSRFSEDLSVQ